MGTVDIVLVSLLGAVIVGVPFIFLITNLVVNKNVEKFNLKQKYYNKYKRPYVLEEYEKLLKEQNFKQARLLMKQCSYYCEDEDTDRRICYNRRCYDCQRLQSDQKPKIEEKEEE